jgi:hypothetical protein
MDELEQTFADGESCPLPAAVAARGEQLGSVVKRHDRGKLPELSAVLSSGGAAIGFVDAGKLPYSQRKHQWFPLQVLSIDKNAVRVRDPAAGPHEISPRQFEQAWKSGEWLITMNLLSLAGKGQDPSKSGAAQPRMWLEMR